MATRIYKTPFAATGDKEALATADQPDGKVSLQAGWTPDYELPNDDANYRPVGRAEMNGIISEITEGLGDVQLHGFATWQAIDGGWPASAQVSHGGAVYRSLVDSNIAEPGPGVAGWIKMPAGIASNAAVQEGTNADQSVTPSGLASLTATTTRRGLIQIATASEVAQGTDSGKAITPAGLQSKVQATQTDTTTGRLLTVGSFGLGFDAFLGESQDLDGVLTSGFYGQNVSGYAKVSLHYPLEGAAGTLLVQSAGQIKTQIFTTFFTAQQFIRTRNNAGEWSIWKVGVSDTDIATSTKAGIARFATISEAAAMVNNGVILSPATLVSAFIGGGNANITPNGFQTLPGGLIIQQMAAPATVNASVTATFPKAFPNACFKVFVCESNSVEWFTDNLVVYGSFAPTKTGVGITAYRWNGSAFSPANGALANVLAIGN